MQGVILNRSGAQVKNLSEAAVAERFFGLQPQNDKPVKSVQRITSVRQRKTPDHGLSGQRLALISPFEGLSHRGIEIGDKGQEFRPEVTCRGKLRRITLRARIENQISI